MNESVKQLRELYDSMTPAARVTAGLLLGVIVVSLGYLFQQHSTGPDEYLFSESLQTREADAALAAIAKKKLTGAHREGNRIRVPRDRKDEYLAAVADGGAMPANFDTLMDEALDVSPFMPQKLQQQRLKSVRERKLSMIVRNMDGIEDAKVMYDIRDPQGFSKQLISATVSVRPVAGETLNAKRTKMIRMAVAGAIAGLEPERVTILDQSSGSEFGGSLASVSPEDWDDPYYQTRSRYEKMMQGRIADLLSDIPGIRIQVSAELDKTLHRETRTVRSDGDAVATHERIQTESVTNERVEAGQQPGLQAQGPNRSLPDEAIAKLVSKTENNDNHTDSFVPTTEEVLRESGLVPTNVKASIAVPTEYLDRVWRKNNPEAAANEQPPKDPLALIEDDITQKIKYSVSKLLPRRATEETLPNVEVTFLPTLVPDAIEEPSLATEGLFWASENLNTLLTAGFALVGLVMLRSLVKSIPMTDSPAMLGGAQLALETEATTTEAAPTETAEQRRPKLKLKKGSNLRDDLTEIVREDPDTAASILRSWIANAG